MQGLKFAFTFSLILNLISAAASWLGGSKFAHSVEHAARPVSVEHLAAAAIPALQPAISMRNDPRMRS
jgi:hypothetical protein